ncbi:hypothetical protein NT05LM_2097 [Listeria marthii FSL S4-120]|uniref:Uncharacterized protein n=1 Tax=Listeria marthii FSL S4-120 TaxID=702457 RepID=A0ABN0BWE0_9LIST|nr:hypothetical protein NT05LM_2097 [Listeria marthii FSL S4-120]
MITNVFIQLLLFSIVIIYRNGVFGESKYTLESGLVTCK